MRRKLIIVEALAAGSRSELLGQQPRHALINAIAVPVDESLQEHEHVGADRPDLPLTAAIDITTAAKLSAFPVSMTEPAPIQTDEAEPAQSIRQT